MKRTIAIGEADWAELVAEAAELSTTWRKVKPADVVRDLVGVHVKARLEAKAGPKAGPKAKAAPKAKKGAKRRAAR